MYKYIFLLFFSGSAFITVSAQQNETIKKAIENPKAKDEAAKADARLIDNKKLVTDSIVVTQKQPAKKKKCWFRKKTKTPSS